MTAERILLSKGGDHREDIRRAAQTLADGGLVAFPTETVYGVAASAADESAVRRLRELKAVTTDQPFTVHLGRRDDWTDYVSSPPPLAERFVRKGWPGPLTLVLPVGDPAKTAIHNRLSELGARSIFAGGTVSLRFPDHPIAAQILADSGAPIIASGASRGTNPAPIDGEDLDASLSDHVDVILEDGPTRYQKGSSVVSIHNDGYTLLRTGAWDDRMIRNLATVQILFVCSGNTCRSPIAEGLFRQMVAKRLGCREGELASRGVIIRSAGTSAYGGSLVSEESVEVCRARGVDITGHRSRRLSLELIHPADYIYTMGAHHADVVRSMAPSVADKVMTLAGDEEISDPIGGTLDEYARVADRIEQALRTRLNEVSL